MTNQSVSLAQSLIRFASVNPPGEEEACITFIEKLLTESGLQVSRHEFALNRPSLVARVPGEEGIAPIVFTGHIDVVPVGTKPWSVSPFDASIIDGKLYGRGSSDMKAGVAAFIDATLRQVKKPTALRRGITLVITAGEETGCQGAFHLDEVDALGRAHLLIVAEPSSNEVVIAHKGSLRVLVRARGKTAHSSMPELGDNAIDKVSRWICHLAGHQFDVEPHPMLGRTTSSVTTIGGGQNINSVPDVAYFTVDFRTIPAHDHCRLLVDLAALFGPEVELEVVTDISGFATQPDDPAIQRLLNILERYHGRPPIISGAPYFTDASALVTAFDGVPTIVVGPGEAAQCHQTDEFCYVERIEQAAEIYYELIEETCR